MFCATLHKRLAANHNRKNILNAGMYGIRASDWCDPPTGDPKYLDFMFSGLEPPK